MAVAASSEERFVESPNLTIVSVNPKIFSVFTPNCPAASATDAISVALLAVDSDKSNKPSFIFSNSSSVPSTVLVTPVNAVSKSIALLATPTNAALAAALTIVSFLPTLVIESPKVCIFVPTAATCCAPTEPNDLASFSKFFSFCSVATISL